jgi:hypothetical protein
MSQYFYHELINAAGTIYDDACLTYPDDESVIDGSILDYRQDPTLGGSFTADRSSTVCGAVTLRSSGVGSIHRSDLVHQTPMTSRLENAGEYVIAAGSTTSGGLVTARKSLPVDDGLVMAKKIIVWRQVSVRKSVHIPIGSGLVMSNRLLLLLPSD